ncbi:MAG: ArsR/SmtB family transcription factor [Candidatus Sumerlaeia bacterium]
MTQQKPEKLDLVSMQFCREAADCLKIMAHPIRLRIVDILMQGEFPVREIAEICELPHHQTCEHLRLLKGYGFLDSERRGREVYYRIAHPRLPSLLNCVRNTCQLKPIHYDG